MNKIHKMILAAADSAVVACALCGHVAALDAFSCGPDGRWLPVDQFHCPACGKGFKRRQAAPVRHASGWIQPGRIELVEIAV
jgi:hypothetical protein